jgi:hypothetical protein
MNNLLVLGALNALKEKGLTIPGDIALIGWDISLRLRISKKRFPWSNSRLTRWVQSLLSFTRFL